MSSVRDIILGALTGRPELVELELLPYARAITPGPQPTLMIRVDKITPTADRIARRTTAALVLVGTSIDPAGGSDDEIDAALEDVLHALDQAEGITWDSAERAVYPVADGEDRAAYEVTVTVYTTHERGT